MILTCAEGVPQTNAAEIISGRATVVALPPSRHCADVARSVVGAILKDLIPERVDDALVMASELSANAWIHGLSEGRKVDGRYASDSWLELAMYRRGSGAGAELVTTFFDPQRNVNILPEAPPNVLAGLPDKPLGGTVHPDVLDNVLEQLQTRRRGLEVVRVLSDGRLGFYRTRSRLRGIPGKAAWFALPFPVTSPAARPSHVAFSPAQAARILRDHLHARGLGHIGHMYCNDQGDRSLISVRHLTIWSHNQSFTWRINNHAVEYSYSDLLEVAEQVIRINEDLEYEKLEAAR